MKTRSSSKLLSLVLSTVLLALWLFQPTSPQAPISAGDTGAQSLGNAQHAPASLTMADAPQRITDPEALKANSDLYRHEEVPLARLAETLPDTPLLTDWRTYNPSQVRIMIEGVPVTFKRTSFTEETQGRMVWVGRLPDGITTYVSAAHKDAYVGIVNSAEGSYGVTVDNKRGVVSRVHDDRPVSCPDDAKLAALPITKTQATEHRHTAGSDSKAAFDTHGIALPITASSTTEATSTAAPSITAAAETFYTIDLALFIDEASFMVEKGDIDVLLTKMIANLATSNQEVVTSKITNFKWRLSTLVIVPKEVYVFSNDMGVDLPKMNSATDPLGILVANTLKASGADEPHLLVTGGGNWGGMAYVGWNYGMTRYDQLFYRSMTHEMGHNFGSNHDRITDKSLGTNQSGYNYGFMFPETAKYYWTTSTVYAGDIMSYSSMRLPHFANPAILYNSKVTESSGVVHEIVDLPVGVAIGQTNAAFNAQSISENAARMAAYGKETAHFLIEPTDKKVGLNESCTFLAYHENSQATYQWYKDDAPITGATSSKYSVTLKDSSLAGKYHCVATVGETQTSSRKASLTAGVARIEQDKLVPAATPNPAVYYQASTLSVTGGSGSGAVSWEIASGSGQGNLQSGKVTPYSTTTLVVKVTKAGDDTYLPATAELSIPVNPGACTISGTLTYDRQSISLGSVASPLTKPTVTNGYLQFRSSDDTVAYVDYYSGNITPRKEGSVTIIAEPKPYSYYAATGSVSSSTITVVTAKAVASLSGTLEYTGTLVCGVAKAPAKTPSASNGSIRYTSSNTAYATVDAATGVITPLIKTDSLTITATLVPDAEYSGIGSASSGNLKVLGAASLGGSLTYGTVRLGSSSSPLTKPTATNGTLSFSCDNTAVATVNATTGVITPVSHGTATITASVSPNTGYVATNTITCGVTVNKAPYSALVNISTRSLVKDGDAIQVAGFIISGTAPKKLLIRAGGPALSQFNITNHLANPMLTVFNSKSEQIASNDDWDPSLDAVARSLYAYNWTLGSKDAALLITLEPGTYTAQVSDPRKGTGICLIEVYDADSENTASRLVNLSTRSLAGHDQENQVAGFIIGGDTPKKLLIRGGGAVLKSFGLAGSIQDPTLNVFNGKSVKTHGCDDWDYSTVHSVAKSVWAYDWAAGSKDAALVVTLEPGMYSAVIAPKTGATPGISLLEIYEVP